MNTAFLLIGGNMGKRGEYLTTARSYIIDLCGPIINLSSVYETAAWGNTEQPGFLNQALEIQTIMNARQLIRKLLKIEKVMGRIRSQKLGPRSIDIDILLFNNERHDTSFLKIPHPELQNRRFALIPLVEIAPDIIHPVLRKKISELLTDCSDTLPVNKVD